MSLVVFLIIDSALFPVVASAIMCIWGSVPDDLIRSQLSLVLFFVVEVNSVCVRVFYWLKHGYRVAYILGGSCLSVTVRVLGLGKLASYRWRILVMTYVCMLSFALVFQSVPPLLTLIRQEFNVSHAQAGLLMSLFAVSLTITIALFSLVKGRKERRQRTNIG
jgi:hypothetical protein